MRLLLGNAAVVNLSLGNTNCLIILIFFAVTACFVSGYSVFYGFGKSRVKLGKVRVKLWETSEFSGKIGLRFTYWYIGPKMSVGT